MSPLQCGLRVRLNSDNAQGDVRVDHTPICQFCQRYSLAVMRSVTLRDIVKKENTRHRYSHDECVLSVPNEPVLSILMDWGKCSEENGAAMLVVPPQGPPIPHTTSVFKKITIFTKHSHLTVRQQTYM